MNRLTILHAVARLLRVPLTYSVRFAPIRQTKGGMRSRRVGEPFDNPADAQTFLSTLKATPSQRKETTNGIYQLVLEGTGEGFYHEAAYLDDTLPAGRPGQVHAGLPLTPQDGPAASPATEAAADEAEGAAGAGADGGHAAGGEAAAEPERSMGEVTDPGQSVLNELDAMVRERQRRAHASSLSHIGER